VVAHAVAASTGRAASVTAIQSPVAGGCTWPW
jgi:hypothetical protein